jgi:hypothetical protein
MQAGPRSEEVGFAHDSALEGAVRCELVSAAGSDSAPYEFLESIKKEGRNAAMPCHLSLVIKINFTWL